MSIKGGKQLEEIVRIYSTPTLVFPGTKIAVTPKHTFLNRLHSFSDLKRLFFRNPVRKAKSIPGKTKIGSVYKEIKNLVRRDQLSSPETLNAFRTL